MTRKDYVKFAQLFSDIKPIWQHSEEINGATTAIEQWKMCVIGACRIFQEDNSRFDRDRFKTACGWE